MKPELQPKPVIKILCPKCKELMVKIYPYSSITVTGEAAIQVPICKKCISKAP